MYDMGMFSKILFPAPEGGWRTLTVRKPGLLSDFNRLTFWDLEYAVSVDLERHHGGKTSGSVQQLYLDGCTNIDELVLIRS